MPRFFGKKLLIFKCDSPNSRAPLDKPLEITPAAPSDDKRARSSKHSMGADDVAQLMMSENISLHLKVSALTALVEELACQIGVL